MGTNFFFHHPWLHNMKLKAVASNCDGWQLPGFSCCQGTGAVRVLPSVTPGSSAVERKVGLAFFTETRRTSLCERLAS